MTKSSKIVLIILVAVLAIAFYLFWKNSAHAPIENESVQVNLYFGKLNEESAFPVSRTLEEKDQIEKRTLDKLLEGPTKEELEQNFFSSINPGVKIRNLRIENGIVYADFNEKLEEGVAGSARVLAIREQIEKTLLQFENINQIVISINGRMDDILQP